MKPVETPFVADHITFKEAAKTLGISYWTVARLVDEFSVPTIRIGATRLASWQHLLAARRASKSKPLAGVRTN